ncbi:nucleotide exchange factor GrpE [Microbacterium marinilacus]|uniref:Protein GrpE n=1 Tax=Microbacterium marinilacus TaxID=415209 RepID=A0ABP7BTD8_9MICO|nr:nucleotide exchange factor GrpE [Microbacterium marinilacus]MBY0689261.1 nucleotide exchange factor GrpE [Microbacterium marinilacus]
MTGKDFEEPQNSGDEVQPEAEGADARDADAPEAQDGATGEGTPQDDASAQAPQDGEAADDGLTVDDILAAQQEDEAAEHDKSDYETHLLHDLKRLQAEYANYRRRTEEQRHVEIARAQGEAVKGLIPVLDDLDRAEKHGDLVDGSAFAAIAGKVRGVAERMGLVAYGEVGETFDPQQHEAIFQQPTPGATETTILDVVELGYRLGDIELRAAKVVVAVPAD